MIWLAIHLHFVVSLLHCPYAFPYNCTVLLSNVRSVDVCHSEQVDAFCKKYFLGGFHKEQSGRLCLLLAPMLVSSKWCSEAILSVGCKTERCRDVFFVHCFVVRLLLLCELCGSVKSFASVVCIQMWGRTTNVVIKKKKKQAQFL